MEWNETCIAKLETSRESWLSRNAKKSDDHAHRNAPLPGAWVVTMMMTTVMMMVVMVMANVMNMNNTDDCDDSSNTQKSHDSNHSKNGHHSARQQLSIGTISFGERGK